VILSPLLAIAIPQWGERFFFSVRRAEAQRIFNEHCKTAGVRIYKKVENVDSVLLMKRRPVDWDSQDQFALIDPYGRDVSREGYAETFLWGRTQSGSPMSTAPEPFAYQSVVMIDADGKGYSRYERTGRRGPNNDVEIERTPTTSLPRYGVSYEDISTRHDRDHWVAGSRLFVVDTRSGEVLAERIGWMFDHALGSRGGFRQPWFFAASEACPKFPTINQGHPVQAGQTRVFVERVLIPSKEKAK
jgi:hypothetical protein